MKTTHIITIKIETSEDAAQACAPIPLDHTLLYSVFGVSYHEDVKRITYYGNYREVTGKTVALQTILSLLKESHCEEGRHAQLASVRYALGL